MPELGFKILNSFERDQSGCLRDDGCSGREIYQVLKKVLGKINEKSADIGDKGRVINSINTSFSNSTLI